MLVLEGFLMLFIVLLAIIGASFVGAIAAQWIEKGG